MKNYFLTIPAAFLLFVGLFSGLYVLLNQLSAKGGDHPKKYLPYSGGQELPPSKRRLTYRAYFRIGFLFGILHLAALMISTLPLKSNTISIGIIYLSGISISAYVLAKNRYP